MNFPRSNWLCLECIFVGTAVVEYAGEQIDKRAADRAPSNVLPPGIHMYAGQGTRVGWTRQTLGVFVWAISLPSPYTDKSNGRGCVTLQHDSDCHHIRPKVRGSNIVEYMMLPKQHTRWATRAKMV